MKPRRSSTDPASPAAPRRGTGDRGASLVLALGVMLAMSGILTGLLGFITTSNRASISLQRTRDAQYAADAATEQAIRFVQTDSARAFLGSFCSSSQTAFYPTPQVINNVSIRVDCAGAPVPVLDDLNRVTLERNVVFLACVDTGVACTESSAILKAKVNFPTNTAGEVVGSFVQSWSVK